MPRKHVFVLKSTGSPMFDAAMLIYGIGAFALFLGYVTVCENL